MVWQDHKLNFTQFFPLFFPALANLLVPALGLHFAFPKGTPDFKEQDAVTLKPGAWTILVLFLLTILLAILYEQVFALPAYLGMMTGLACLMFHAYWRQRRLGQPCDIFHQIREIEWDTLLFFFGVVFAVGGLRYLGYLTLASHFLYDGLGPTMANILVGFLSAVVDNIPLMLAVLHMNPAMDVYQWQLVTLTAGVGGSMLAVGSAAGVAMLGQARGLYTSLFHLRWAPLIVLGYIASIAVHHWLNAP
jgi:Na+/H+ antiporter NhaD/arsenite permease-like protein